MLINVYPGGVTEKDIKAWVRYNRLCARSRALKKRHAQAFNSIEAYHKENLKKEVYEQIELFKS